MGNMIKSYRLACPMHNRRGDCHLSMRALEDSELTATAWTSLRASQDLWSTYLIRFNELVFSLHGLIG